MNFKKFYRIIEEGGQYGHMTNVHEDFYLTYQDLHKMVEDMFSGGITEMKEKTDGQALSFSYKDGSVIFSRNASQTINGGANALKGAGAVKRFFKDHPNEEVKNAFSKAASDVDRAITNLTSKQKGLLKNGLVWIAFEIIYPGTTNVIPYYERKSDSNDSKSKRNLIVFHSYREYDESGKVVGSDFDEYGRMFAGMLKQKGLNNGQYFEITSMPKIELMSSSETEDGVHQVVNFGDKKLEFKGEIEAIRNRMGLGLTDTVGDYWEQYMMQLVANAAKINGFTLPESTLRKIATRLAYKKVPPARRPSHYKQALQNINHLNNELGTTDNSKVAKQWLRSFENSLDYAREYNNMIEPFKVLMLRVGVELADNVSNLLTLNPAKSVQDIKADLDRTLAEVQRTGDEKLMNDVQYQLDLISKIGGLEKIAPTEGIVFTYTTKNEQGEQEQKIYKLTGSFAPINQILGSIKFSR